MILRRLTKHVNDQNWFAVALDFFIVVVGILLAFQITNWSEARQDALIYEQARTRVIEEANANLAFAQNTIERLDDQLTQTLVIIRDFETCGADEAAEERFINTLQFLRFILGLEIRDDAIHQILSSDAFLDNISPEDRVSLSTYARRVAVIGKNSQFSDSFQLGRPPPQDNPIFKREVGENFDRGLADLVLTVSYEQACKDTALNQFLYDRLENGTYIVSLARGLARASRDVLIGLGEDVPDLEVAP